MDSYIFRKLWSCQELRGFKSQRSRKVMCPCSSSYNLEYEQPVIIPAKVLKKHLWNMTTEPFWWLNTIDHSKWVFSESLNALAVLSKIVLEVRKSSSANCKVNTSGPHWFDWGIITGKLELKPRNYISLSCRPFVPDSKQGVSDSPSIHKCKQLLGLVHEEEWVCPTSQIKPACLEIFAMEYKFQDILAEFTSGSWISALSVLTTTKACLWAGIGTLLIKRDPNTPHQATTGRLSKMMMRGIEHLECLGESTAS